MSDSLRLLAAGDRRNPSLRVMNDLIEGLKPSRLPGQHGIGKSDNLSNLVEGVLLYNDTAYLVPMYGCVALVTVELEANKVVYKIGKPSDNPNKPVAFTRDELPIGDGVGRGYVSGVVKAKVILSSTADSFASIGSDFVLEGSTTTGTYKIISHATGVEGDEVEAFIDMSVGGSSVSTTTKTLVTCVGVEKAAPMMAFIPADQINSPGYYPDGTMLFPVDIYTAGTVVTDANDPYAISGEIYTVLPANLPYTCPSTPDLTKWTPFVAPETVGDAITAIHVGSITAGVVSPSSTTCETDPAGCCNTVTCGSYTISKQLKARVWLRPSGPHIYESVPSGIGGTDVLVGYPAPFVIGTFTLQYNMLYDTSPTKYWDSGRPSGLYIDIPLSKIQHLPIEEEPSGYIDLQAGAAQLYDGLLKVIPQFGLTVSGCELGFTISYMNAYDSTDLLYYAAVDSVNSVDRMAIKSGSPFLAYGPLIRTQSSRFFIELFETEPAADTTTTAIWYTLDQQTGTTVTDHSGHSRSGTLSGSAAWYNVSGISPGEYALQLSGGKLVAGSSYRLPNSNWTVNLWAFNGSWSSSTSVLVSTVNQSDGTGGFSLQVSSGKLHLLWRGGSGGDEVTTFDAPNTFSMITITCSSSGVEIFINGVSVFTKSANTSCDNSLYPLTIGNAASGSNPYSGYVRSVQAWESKLTTAQIAELWYEGFGHVKRKTV